MKWLVRTSCALAVVSLIVVGSLILTHETSAVEKCDKTQEICNPESLLELSTTLSAIKAPAIATPAWVNPPAAPPQPKPNTGRVVTYSVETRGAITADLAQFKQLSNETLNDSRGWSNLGVKFSQVASGGDFTLVLAVASELPNFSEGCTADYSCNVGRYVIINQDRWQGATPSWNNAGGSLRDYRHMVVNHETGHWLGHGHASCGGAGQSAPLMQQQSMDLQGCAFNAWPLNSELSSRKLGIA